MAEPSTADFGGPGQVFETLMQWEPIFQSVAEQLPGNAQLWCARGRFLARRSRWKDAADAYARVAESSRPRLEYAFVLLLADQPDGYRSLCEKLDEGGALYIPPGASSWGSAEVCAAGASSGVDPARIVSWAEATVAQTRTKFSWRALAAAEYRAGQYDNAIRHGLEALDQQESRSNIAFLLALAYYRSGDLAASQTWYGIGSSELQRVTPKNPDDPGPWSMDHWLNVNVMAREATAVLGEKATPDGSTAEKTMP